MNNLARFFMAFALLALVGTGCFSAEVAVEDEMMEDEMMEDEMDSDEDEDEDEMEDMLAMGEYTVDVENSTVTWVGRKTGGQHDGTIGLSEGSLSVADTTTGSVTIDMTSIVVLDIEDADSNASLVTHLEGEDFFAVEEYPTAVFEITSLEMGDDGYMVEGMLTMKGNTNTVSFPAEVEMVDGGYQMTAEFELDRSKWDIRFGSATLLGDAVDVLIDDMMTIGLDVMLVE